MAGGVEIDYAQITSTFSNTNTSMGNVTGLAAEGTTSGIVDVWFRTDAFTTPGTFGAKICLMEDGVDICTMAYSTSTAGLPVCTFIRRNPTAGFHTWQIRAVTITAGTYSILAGLGSGGANSPAAIQVLTVD